MALQDFLQVCMLNYGRQSSIQHLCIWPTSRCSDLSCMYLSVNGGGGGSFFTPKDFVIMVTGKRCKTSGFFYIENLNSVFCPSPRLRFFVHFFSVTLKMNQMIENGTKLLDLIIVNHNVNNAYKNYPSLDLQVVWNCRSVTAQMDNNQNFSEIASTQHCLKTK